VPIIIEGVRSPEIAKDEDPRARSMLRAVGKLSASGPHHALRSSSVGLLRPRCAIEH
jgi:hypothetical protein